MKKYINGQYVEMTAEEILSIQTETENLERQYWLNTPYNELVNQKIRERYTISQEFAILRQKEDKPDEYILYYAYCEECKAFVKEQISKYSI